jgi:predicted DNA-binding transcriptional regulator AlpA
MEQLLDIKGVATLLNVSVSTVKTWLREKDLPCIRISKRSLRYTPADVIAWANNQRKALEEAKAVPRREHTDWQGNPVPDGETLETRIKWWEVDPHPTEPGLVLRERSWQKMLTAIGGNWDLLLEDDLVEKYGLVIKFRVVEGTVEEYVTSLRLPPIDTEVTHGE